MTYCLRADVWVPNLGLEPHAGWSKRILSMNLDVNGKGAALVWCIWRTEELAAKVCEIIAVPRRLYFDLRELVILDIGNLFGDTSCAVGSHGGSSVRLSSGFGKSEYVGERAGSERCQCWKKVSLGFKRQQRPSGAHCTLRHNMEILAWTKEPSQ